MTLIENIKEKFWKNYLNVLASDSSLMKYPCWYKQSRRPQKGDVVLVLYKTRVSESYRLGRIEAIDENSRNLELVVSPHQAGNTLNLKAPAKMLVPVQRTILLYSPHDDKEGTQEATVDVQPREVTNKLKVRLQNKATEITDMKDSKK